jgi:hypothetical protein
MNARVAPTRAHPTNLFWIIGHVVRLKSKFLPLAGFRILFSSSGKMTTAHKPTCEPLSIALFGRF